MMLPTVTILTPTKNRPGFLELCAKYVNRQTYPKDLLQWVIVHAPGEFRMPKTQIRVAWTVVSQSGVTGAMRNEGLKHATGDIIVHFDDDDWQAPDRIERQVAAFDRSHVELVCSDNFYILLLDEEPPRAQKSVSWDFEMFLNGCTFAYRKSAWKRHPFPAIPIGEDQVFARVLRYVNRAGVKNLRDPGLMVYVRHGSNTCAFDEIMREKADFETAEWVKDKIGWADYEALSSACKELKAATTVSM